jgi:hypothetical protein
MIVICTDNSKKLRRQPMGEWPIRRFGLRAQARTGAQRRAISRIATS